MGSLLKFALIINVGSSSIKFSYFEKDQRVFSGGIFNIGSEALFKIEGNHNSEEKLGALSYTDALEYLLQKTTELFKTIDVVGHRVVFGGNQYKEPTILTPEVLKELYKLVPFAPLHLPKELTAIDRFLDKFQGVLQVACFDTSFHQTLPKKAYMIPLAKELYKHEIRSFGYHGLSYEYIHSKLLENEKKVIVAHLGSGASLCAIESGKCVDTSMSFTPLGGIMMGTRTGDLDPGVLMYLLQVKEIDPKQLSTYLNEKSGLLGVSELSSDMHVLELSSSDLAKDAIELFCYKVAKQIGAYFVTLGGLDLLVFTAGIGESSSLIREKVCSYLTFLGIDVDPKKNNEDEEVISSISSKIVVKVIKTDEESVIAKHALLKASQCE